MSDGLCEGWATAALGNLVELRYGKALPEALRRPGDVAVFGSNGVVGSHSAAVTSGPTIVVGRKGSVGEVHLSSKLCWPIDTTYFIDAFGPFDPAFLAHQLRSMQLARDESSTAIPGLSRDDAYARVAVVPPLAEQTRIVEKVEGLLLDARRASERFTRAATVLKRLRQSLLAAACTGSITDDWRGQHSLPRPVVPVRVAERRSRRGANLASADAIELDDLLPELPDSWIYARLDQLAAPETVVTYGIVLPGPEIPGGVPYVRQQDIEGGTIKVSELRHTTKVIAAKHSRSELRAGDVLLCIIRNLRVAVVPPGLDGANITQGSVRIRPAETLVRGDYLAAYLESPHAQAWLMRRYFGMDMPRVNVEDARAVPVALQPIEEQDAILERIRNVETLRSTTAGRAARALARAHLLPQAILSKAFSGSLVPTEAELARAENRELEDASALLTRIGDNRGEPARAVRGKTRLKTKSASK